MVWYGMVVYGMVWYGMIWYGKAWHGMVWHGMAFIIIFMEVSKKWWSLCGSLYQGSYHFGFTLGATNFGSSQMSQGQNPLVRGSRTGYMES